MDPEADSLYDLPPDEFTAARDALAARLRAEGRRDDAADVRGLRRPTAAAAALNRTVRRDPDAVEEVLAAGRNLGRAQERLVAGKGDRAVLREAAEHVREAISRLAGRAVAEGGLSPAAGDRVRATLHAALVDDSVREALKAGRLQRDAEAGAVGFPPVPAGAAPSTTRRGAAKPSGAGRRSAAAREREAAERLKRASRAVREAQRRLDRAVQHAERTSAAVDDLRARLAAAEADASDAARDAEALRSELRAAKSEEAAALEDAG